MTRGIGWATLVLMVAMATGFAVGSPRAASDPISQDRAAVLHLKFRSSIAHEVACCGSAPVTSGRYALVQAVPNGCHELLPVGRCYPPRFLLLDDRAGTQSLIRAPSLCSAAAIGSPWVLFSCPDLELYDLKTGKWQHHLERCGCIPAQTTAFHLGARWMRLDVTGNQDCGDHVHYYCGPITHAFYNLQTRQVRAEPHTTGTQIVDLDSPSLTRSVCAPLHMPSDGSIALYGSLAVVSIDSNTLEYGTQQYKSFFLERCGSHLHMPIGQTFDHGASAAPTRLFANAHAVIWPLLDAGGSSWQARFAGILLPSLRRFTAAVPRSVHVGTQAVIALDDVRMYVTDASGRVWSAALPPPQGR
jgi:hypothetical protein